MAQLGGGECGPRQVVTVSVGTSSSLESGNILKAIDTSGLFSKWDGYQGGSSYLISALGNWKKLVADREGGSSFDIWGRCKEWSLNTHDPPYPLDSRSTEGQGTKSGHSPTPSALLGPCPSLHYPHLPPWSCCSWCNRSCISPRGEFSDDK